MNNWFDDEKRNDPATPSETADDASHTEPASAGSSNDSPPARSSGWTSSPSSPIPPIPPQGTNDPNTNPYAGTTYRYGVNAPNPVPPSDPVSPSVSRGESTASPAQNATPSGGSYRPQGGYDPYSWQRAQNSSNPGGYPPPSKPPKKKKNGAAIAIAALSVVCAAAIVTLSVLLAMAVGDNNTLPQGDVSSSQTRPSNPTRDVNNSAPNLQISTDPDETQGLSTRSIVEKNLDSTVVITTYSKSSGLYGQGGGLTESGAASGIVWTSDGYIITNWHVVVNENTGMRYDRVDVKLYDGTEYENAEVIGADQYTDLAVIKIDATNLTAAEFGDSSSLHLGDKVVAIGNAGGLNFTTTQGIVSGLARDVYDDTGYAIKCLQVDAAINPGNSGGPLLNAQGQVVAVNSAKIVATGYEGLGFSIPINEAKTILEDLVKYGYVKGRVMLGIGGRSLTGTGFRIEEIYSESCLNGTEAQVGDIITHVAGVQVTDYSTMRAELAKHEVGETIELTLLRPDSRTGTAKTITVTCTLAEAQG